MPGVGQAETPDSSRPWVNVFQLSVAHLIRTGNLTTPCSAASSPSASMSMTSGSAASPPPPSAPSDGSVDSWIDIICLKVPISSRTSASDLPLTAADMSEADDWLIEQPVPAILMSARTPSSTSMVTTISSPQSGLNPSTRTAGGDSSSPRLRGER